MPPRITRTYSLGKSLRAQDHAMEISDNSITSWVRAPMLPGPPGSLVPPQAQQRVRPGTAAEPALLMLPAHHLPLCVFDSSWALQASATPSLLGSEVDLGPSSDPLGLRPQEAGWLLRFPYPHRGARSLRTQLVSMAMRCWAESCCSYSCNTCAANTAMEPTRAQPGA